MNKLAEHIRKKAEGRDALKRMMETQAKALEDARRLHESTAGLLRDAEIELKALKHAASLVGAPYDGAAETAISTADEPPKKAGGRQRGAISVKWRRALADLVAAGNSPVDQHQFFLLTRGRLGLAETAVREGLRRLVGNGHVIETNDRVSVSKAAIERFGLDRIDVGGAAEEDGGEDDESYPRDGDVEHNEKAPH